LPFPAFDGGRILFLIIEKIRRKPINPKVENTVNAVGFGLLMVLILFVTINDVLRLIK
jgi:regulator of sigma E protease